jgi:hypothetical protein
MLFALTPFACLSIACFGYLADTILRLIASGRRFPLGWRLIAWSVGVAFIWLAFLSYKVTGSSSVGILAFCISLCAVVSIGLLVLIVIGDEASKALEDNFNNNFDLFRNSHQETIL